eukprot:12929229-Prorocentrum_lima.AAC.1
MRELSSEMVHVETEAMGQAQENCRTWVQAQVSERGAVLAERAKHQDMEDRARYQDLCNQFNQER